MRDGRERLTNWLWLVRGWRGIRILCAGARLAQTLRAASLVSCKSGTIAVAWRPRCVASLTDFKRLRDSGWSTRERYQKKSSSCQPTRELSDLAFARCCRASARFRVSVRASRSFSPFLWETAKTKTPWYQSASKDICRQEARRARVTVTQKILHGRMDKDFRRKYKKMRCGLLHLLLIVGGKFHYTVLSSTERGRRSFSSDLDASLIIAPVRRSPSTFNLRTEELIEVNLPLLPLLFRPLMRK